MTITRLFLVSFLFLVSQSALAYKVQPMLAEIAPIGKGSQMTMRIDNTGDSPLTIELVPLSFTMDEYGKETTESAEDDLLVIPSSAIVAPGRSQAVIVRYLGNPSITTSKPYRISVRQVKVSRSGQEQASLGLLLQFDTLLNVRPKNTNPNLSVNSVTKNEDNWLVSVENSGNSYGRITRTNWTISDKSHSLFVKNSEIGELIGGSLVLPNSKRIFTMKALDGFDIKTVDIKLENAN